MEKIILLLFIFGITSIITMEKEDRQDLKKYEQLTYDGYRAFRKKDYPKAFTLYMEAFHHVEAPFGLDLFRALTSAVEIEEWDQASTWTACLMKKGSPLTFFQQSIFSSFRKQPQWANLEQQYPQYHKYFLESCDLKLRDQINDLHEEDQAIARAFHNANVHPDYPKVTAQFKQMVSTNGFPGEKRVGVRIEKDTIIMRPAYHVIMLHHYHKGEYIFRDQLAEWTAKGLLHPAEKTKFEGYIIDDPEVIKRLNSKRKAYPKQ